MGRSHGTPPEVVITEVVITEVVITEVDQGTPPQKWSSQKLSSRKLTPPEVVMEMDQGNPPGSGHGSGPGYPPQDKDQATCKVFTISICRLNLVYVCF